MSIEGVASAEMGGDTSSDQVASCKEVASGNGLESGDSVTNCDGCHLVRG